MERVLLQPNTFLTWPGTETMSTISYTKSTSHQGSVICSCLEVRWQADTTCFALWKVT
jgi:hypothetical protein